MRGINLATKGPSYWKLNVSLLKRLGCEKIVKELIRDLRSSRDKYHDLATWWNMLKLAIQMRLKEYGKQQSVL